MEGQEVCGNVDGVLACQDVLGSAFLLNHVRESLKRKGLLGREVVTASAAVAAVATSVDVAHESNNLPLMREEGARPIEERDVAWILARLRNQQARSLDFSAFGEFGFLSSIGIQNLLIEGVRNGAIFGPAWQEMSCTGEKLSFDKAGCSSEMATTTPGRDQSSPEAATGGTMDPLTPEIVQQTCRERSPGSSADSTFLPEAADPGVNSSTQGELISTAGDWLSIGRGTPFRAPAMANGAAAMLAKETITPLLSPSRSAQPRAQEQVTQREVPENPQVTGKSTRKRKYLPKIRAENPRPTCRTKKSSVEAALPAEIPSSASLVHMKSFARINQRSTTLKRPRRGKAAAAAIPQDSPANCTPGCSFPPSPTADPAAQDAITQSANFLRFLHESLFSYELTKLCPADRADSSLCTCSPDIAEEEEEKREREVEVDVDRSPAAEEPPSTPRGVPVPLVSTCWDFTLVRSPWSPPSIHEAVDVASRWNNLDDITNSHDESAKSVRRALKFDAAPLQGGHVHLCNDSLQSLASTSDIDLLQVPAEKDISVPQVATMDPGGPRRENELQIVAYDEGFKRIVAYQRRVPRMRRLRYKPKVNLDARTLRMFKTLTIKAAGVGDGEEEADDEKTGSWEQSRKVWKDRAHHFISIMRQVQGNRSFSRWKGSVVDSVGGAFLTQNVSDFLSSNAFISLRARFPARPRDAMAAESTPKAQSPVEKQRSVSTDSFPPHPPECSSTPRKGDHPRHEESSTRESPACLPSQTDGMSTAVGDQPLADLSTGLDEPCPRPCRTGENFSGEGSPSRQEAAAPAPGTCTTTQGMTERPPHHLISEEMVGVKESSPPSLINAAPEIETWAMLHHPDQQNVSSSDESFFPIARGIWQPNCVQTHSSTVADGELVSGRKFHQQSSWRSSWKKRQTEPGVLQMKFASVVAAERASSSTAVGQENLVLAATLTLRLVLGKKQTTQEQLPWLPRDLHDHPNAKMRRSLKQLQLRPARALMRSSTDNYRYRRSVSFKLLTGEARASWEAGFVMKSQKAKWEPRRAAIVGDPHYRRDPWTADCVDWNAVRKASVHEVAQVIKNRGMNNALAGRMKAFLDRVHRDQDDGSIDLEWIRWLPPEDAKAFLLSFRGVGIKSVECIRLLTLHHPSFPVDTNVGRILVRLGWVPLEPLPEETQLHLLELYPIQSQIQQYAWPRLCTLDQKTLYELHYQMITFGKVFCTKSKPNCNACPMRTECKHYASSYASAKLLLKGREEQEKRATAILALRGTEVATVSIQYGQLRGPQQACVPIIEEPRSPEPSIPDIEELPVDFDSGAGVGVSVQIEIVDMREFSSAAASLGPEGVCVKKTRSLDLNREPEEDTDVLPTTAMDMDGDGDDDGGGEKKGKDKKTIATMANHETLLAAEENLEGVPLQGGVPDDFKHLPSQELILLPPQASMAPAPKLKNIQRLRTVHFVYELPDNHPLLFEMDKREADDPCFYLLAIWSPDEVPATMPKINDDESRNPFASCEGGCNEDPEQMTVRGTLLIPCKTAMRGSFPLNGTYFQVNEVFADHASSVQPIDVPRTLLWSLRRRFVYFSTAVSNLFKDMSQDEIQCCFQKGYVCLRAFDVATREPKILAPRLHQSGAKIVKAPTPRKGRPRKTPSKGQLPTNENAQHRSPTGEATSQAMMDSEIPCSLPVVPPIASQAFTEHACLQMNQPAGVHTTP